MCEVLLKSWRCLSTPLLTPLLLHDDDLYPLLAKKIIFLNHLSKLKCLLKYHLVKYQWHQWQFKWLTWSFRDKFLAKKSLASFVCLLYQRFHLPPLNVFTMWSQGKDIVYNHHNAWKNYQREEIFKRSSWWWWQSKAIKVQRFCVKPFYH